MDVRGLTVKGPDDEPFFGYRVWRPHDHLPVNYLDRTIRGARAAFEEYVRTLKKKKEA